MIQLYKKMALLIAGLFLVFAVSAQQTLKLIDTNNGKEISGATYKYGSQTGVSNAEGELTLSFQEGENLQLSHISYGAWMLTANDLKQALANGVISREPLSFDIYPVSVIAIHPNVKNSKELSVSYNDKMAHDGGAVLQNNPAISGIRKSGNYGFDPVLRGFKYEQLNVIMNGAQTAIAACPNRMDPPTSQMAPNMMDRVEIIKGPHGLRYGNSFGGTINFIPTAPNFGAEKPVYGRLSGAYESNGQIFRTEGLVGVRGKKYDIGFFGAWSQGDDYTTGEGNSIASGFSRNSFGTNVNVAITQKQTITMAAHRNVAKDVDFAALMMDLRNDDTWMVSLSHKYEADGEYLQEWNTNLNGTYVDHLMDNLLKNMDPRMVNAATAAKTSALGFRTEGEWLFKQQKLFVGLDYKLENAEGTREREFLMGPMAGNTLYDNVWQGGGINKSSLFAEYQLPKGDYTFVFAGRLELNNADLSDADAGFDAVYADPASTQINPSLSIGGVRTYGGNFTTGLWLGRTQRSGSLTERYINYFPVGQDPYEMLGNPELSPEVNNQLDIKLGYKSLNADVSLDLFAGYLQNYISSVIDTTLSPRIPSSPGVRQFINVDGAFMTGFEFAWGQRIYKQMKHQFNLAYTYGNNLELDEPLAEIAPLDMRYALYADLFKNKFRPELVARYVIKQDRIAESYGETETPAFFLMDLKLGYQINDFASLSGGVQNLFDVAYYEHLNRSVGGNTANPIYAPGRNFFLSFSLSLN